MKALVLFSGGIDSTTALGLAIQKYGKDQVIALSVSYGQKHDKEIKAAIAVAQYYGVEHLFLDLRRSVLAFLELFSLRSLRDDNFKRIRFGY